MIDWKKAAPAVCLAGILLLAAGCGGPSKDEANQSRSLPSGQTAPQSAQPEPADDPDTAQPIQPADAAPPEPAQTDTIQTEEAFGHQEEDIVFDVASPEPDGDEKTEDASPSVHLGNLEFQAYVNSADTAYNTADWPGRVCKSREQLEDLVDQLAEASPNCARMLDICDDSFFTQKAILFAAKNSSGVYGGSAYAAVREAGAVTIFVDRIRAYGLPGPYACDELYFLAVDTRLVSVHDTVRALYKERDWAAAALGGGARVTKAGTVSRVNIRMLTDKDYDGYHIIVDHDKMGAKIFLSKTELDAWLSAIDTRAVINLPDEGQMLAEKLRSLHINFKTTGLAVCFTSGVSDYLGAAVDGGTVRLGLRHGGGGCIPDSGVYIVIQPISLDELGDASRVECSIV